MKKGRELQKRWLTGTVNGSKDLSSNLSEEDLSDVYDTIYPESASFLLHGKSQGSG